MLAAVKRLMRTPRKRDVHMCVFQLAVKHTLTIENNLFAKHNLTCLQLDQNNWGEPE